jgi:hypothetical protein
MVALQRLLEPYGICEVCFFNLSLVSGRYFVATVYLFKYVFHIHAEKNIITYISRVTLDAIASFLYSLVLSMMLWLGLYLNGGFW